MASSYAPITFRFAPLAHELSQRSTTAAYLRFAAATFGGGSNNTTICREPHCGHLKRLSKGDSGEGSPARPYQCLHVQFFSVDAFASRLGARAVPAAVSAAGDDSPAEGMGLSNGLDRHEVNGGKLLISVTARFG